MQIRGRTGRVNVKVSPYGCSLFAACVWCLHAVMNPSLCVSVYVCFVYVYYGNYYSGHCTRLNNFILDNKDFICERQVLLTSFNSGGNKDEGAQEPRQLAE